MTPKTDMTAKEKALEFSEMFIDIQSAIMWVECELRGDNLMWETVEEWQENYWYWVEVKNELNKL
jgi:hypothetical protein